MDASAGFYPIAEYALSAAAVAALMFGMGATLRHGDFRALVEHPRALVAGLGLQWAVVPALAWAVTRLIALQPGVATGLLLLAAVPGGSLSNAATWLARGNVALSVSLTAITTLACPLVVPVVMTLADASLDLRALPARVIATEVGAWMLPALLAGMAVRRQWPASAERIARMSVLASFVPLSVLWISGASLSSGGGHVPGAALGAVGALVLLSVAAAGLVARFIGATRADRTALSIEVAYRNLGLVFLLKAFLFPEGDAASRDVLLVVIAYGPLAFVPVAAIVSWNRLVRTTQ